MVNATPVLDRDKYAAYTDTQYMKIDQCFQEIIVDFPNTDDANICEYAALFFLNRSSLSNKSSKRYLEYLKNIKNTNDIKTIGEYCDEDEENYRAPCKTALHPFKGSAKDAVNKAFMNYIFEFEILNIQWQADSQGILGKIDLLLSTDNQKGYIRSYLLHIKNSSLSEYQLSPEEYCSNI